MSTEELMRLFDKPDANEKQLVTHLDDFEGETGTGSPRRTTSCMRHESGLKTSTTRLGAGFSPSLPI
jgi:hypothetical protein